MQNDRKTKSELIEELESVRKKMKKMEVLQENHKHTQQDITEEKRLPEGSDASEEDYRGAFETSQDGLLHVHRSKGDILDANAYAQKLLGYSKEEFSKHKLWGIGVVKDDEDYQEALSRLEKDGVVYYGNKSVKNKAGLFVDTEIILVDKAKFIQCNIRDNTTRKQAEEQLRQSEERFRLIAENAADLIAVLDLEGKRIYSSPSYKSILGDQESLRGTDSFQEIHPEDREKIKRIFLETVRTGIGQRSEYRFLLKDRSVRYIESMGSVIRDENGNTNKVVVVSRDITERKLAEQELRESKALIEAVVENVPLMIFLKEAEELRFVVFNRAGEELLGYARKDLLGRNDLSFFPPEQAAYFMATDREVLDGETGMLDIPEEPIMTAKKGQRLLHTRKICIKGVDGVTKYLLGISDDITERKQSEEKNRQLQQQLIQAQKLESLGTLASGIAHDFNNILGIILAYSSLLEKIKMGSEKYSESLNAITNAVQRGAALVRQILTFARKTDILFEPMNLMDLVHEILSMLQQTFPKTIIFKENIENDIPYIFADRTQIYQALLNLYVNARDAMPNGGCITLAIEKRTGEQIRGQFPTANQDLYLCVSVTDNGIGLDEATRSRIFDPFFTTKEKGKGTGLGLSVVFGVVQTHHGFIDVESEPGKGTTFLLYLPALQTVESIREEERKTIIEEKLGGTETLLVIEDEKALSELVRLLLETKGYKVYTAQDGNEAIEVYKRYQEEIDIVLTDMGLPGMTGAEVFKKLKEINPNISVIFCSGSNESDITSELSKAGAKGFIQKPYNPNELLRKLREALDEK